MPNLSRIPLPSITLVLSTDHTRILRRPSVIQHAAPPIPVIEVHPPEDSVKQVDLGDINQYLNVEDRMPKCHVHPDIPHEDDDNMDFTESICEAPILDQQERFLVVRFIKERISNALFSIRRVLCVDLPQTCFPGVTRQ